MSSSLEVSKNLKFSYSSRAADGLRMPRMWDRSGRGEGGGGMSQRNTLAGQGFSKFSLVVVNGDVNPFRGSRVYIQGYFFFLGIEI